MFLYGILIIWKLSKIVTYDAIHFFRKMDLKIKIPQPSTADPVALYCSKSNFNLIQKSIDFLLLKFASLKHNEKSQKHRFTKI